MPRLIWLALALAACAQPGPGPVVAFRQPGAPIWSAAAFDPARLDGRWVQVAALSDGTGPGCAAGEVSFGPGGQVAGALCLNGRVVRLQGVADPAGPGRLAMPGMADWWIIWVDEGYRTLAVATPSGAFGFVLDRGRIGADRLAAAGEIFAFNGHNPARLQPF